MPDFSRRKLLLNASLLPLMPYFSRAEAAESGSPISFREMDISKYTHMILPREHGQLASTDQSIFRRYPSREQSMQMIAFFNNKQGLLVIANDLSGAISDWKVDKGKFTLFFYHRTQRLSDVIILPIEPTLDSIAAAYKNWAMKQPWLATRKRSSENLRFISVASHSSIEQERLHHDKIMRHITGKSAVWLTQWRKHPFDRQYPDYQPKQPNALADWLRDLRRQNITALPYMNALLWDINNRDFRHLGDQIALIDKKSAAVSYNDKLDFLKYACVGCSQWIDALIHARENILDSEGQISSGVYLDMLGASVPLLCFSKHHDHEPGDPRIWQRGLTKLLQDTRGKIMIEGCAEVYLNQTDYALMHLYTDREDMVPLWQKVYGDIVQPVGWKIPDSLSAESVNEIITRINKFNGYSLGSPWMTSVPENKINYSLFLARQFDKNTEIFK